MTSVVLRPDGTTSNPIATITGAATAHAAVNDSSDASYLTSDLAAGILELSMGTTSLPAGAVTKTLTLTVRADFAAVTDSFVYIYAEGAIDCAFTPGSLLGNYSSAPTAVNYSQSWVDAMTFRWYSPVLTGELLYDVYATLVYATQPTCAVTAPTGSITTTSTPSVTWTHTPGSDGGAQTRYQVRVFSAAEYTVSGFDPGVSPCTWTSGDTAGSNTSTTSGTLANSTTYRAYVRTAQTINGQSHWSEWAYSSFSTSFTTPDITSVTVTGDNTYARHRIVVSRNTGTPLWVTLDVERSDDSGTSWTAVRGATGVTPAGDMWIGYDYEGTNGVAAIYRARGATTLVTGPWATSTGATWSSTSHWLKDLLTPGNSMEIEVSGLPQRVWPIVQGVHRPVGRPDPVVTSDVRQMHTASVEFEVYTATEADELRTLLAGDTLLLQLATGVGYGNIYLRPGTISERKGAEEIGSEWRYLTVDYVEVAAPPDDGVGSLGLTWQDVVDTYATWADLIAAVPTWGDLI